MASRQVAPDFRDDFPLCSSQLERKRLHKFIEQRAGPAVCLAYANRCIRASRCNQDLHRKKFREDQVFAGGIALLPIVWKWIARIAAERVMSRFMSGRGNNVSNPAGAGPTSFKS